MNTFRVVPYCVQHIEYIAKIATGMKKMKFRPH